MAMDEKEKAEFDAAKKEAAEAREQLEKLKGKATKEEKLELVEIEARLAKAEEGLKAGKGKDAAEIRGASEDSIHAVLENLRELLKRMREEKPKSAVRWSPW